MHLLVFFFLFFFDGRVSVFLLLLGDIRSVESHMRHRFVFVLSILCKNLVLPRIDFAICIRGFGEMKTVKTACGLVGLEPFTESREDSFRFFI